MTRSGRDPGTRLKTAKGRTGPGGAAGRGSVCRILLNAGFTMTMAAEEKTDGEHKEHGD